MNTASAASQLELAPPHGGGALSAPGGFVSRAVRIRPAGVLCAILLVMAVFWGIPRDVRAQDQVAYDPYRVEVLFQVDPAANLSDTWLEQLKQDVMHLVAQQAGGMWDVAWTDVPADRMSLAEAMQRELLAWPARSGYDTRLVVAVAAEGAGYRIAARQWDGAASQWGPGISRFHPSTFRLAENLAWLLGEAFVPVVEIVEVDEDRVIAVPRAAALAAGESSRFTIPVGSFLQPIIAVASRPGSSARVDARPVPWTILRVERAEPVQLVCRVYSAFSQPLRQQRSRRVRQLATLIRPGAMPTTLKLVDRSDPPRPLVGYQVIGHSVEGETVYWKANTDWRGEVTVAWKEEDPRLQWCLIKSGGRMIARLPLLLGAEAELTVSLPEDPAIIAADAFVQTVQQDLLELVVRRQLLGLRIERLLEAGRTDEAEEALRELMQMDTQSEFLNRMQLRQQQLVSGNRAVQVRVERLFAESRKLVSDVLDPGYVRRYQAAVAQARTQ